MCEAIVKRIRIHLFPWRAGLPLPWLLGATLVVAVTTLLGCPSDGDDGAVGLVTVEPGEPVLPAAAG